MRCYKELSQSFHLQQLQLYHYTFQILYNLLHFLILLVSLFRYSQIFLQIVYRKRFQSRQYSVVMVSWHGYNA
jgi:hypothetical protein